MRASGAPLALLLVAAVAGCTAEAGSPQTPSPFAGCAALTAGPSGPAGLRSVVSGPAAPVSVDSAAAVSRSAVPRSAALTGSASSAGTPLAAGLPDLRLPCFTGGSEVALRDLHGPAVINIWASWCGPCRRELPVMQRLADRAGDRLTVLTVDTGDGREAGASFAAGRGVTMPTLFDQERKLINALGRTTLPITIFLDDAGRARVTLLPLDAAGLTEQVRSHTGVTVTL